MLFRSVQSLDVPWWQAYVLYVGHRVTEIARNAPLAVQASKRMMRMGMNETFNDHVHHVFLQLLPLFRSADFKEGMASFLEKRPPNFTGK